MFIPQQTLHSAKKSCHYCLIWREKSQRRCKFHKSSSVPATRQVQQDGLNASSIPTGLPPTSGSETFFSLHQVTQFLPTLHLNSDENGCAYTTQMHVSLQKSHFVLKLLERPSPKVQELLLLFLHHTQATIHMPICI